MLGRHPRFAEALALHRRLPVVDAHADTVLALLAGERKLGQRSASGHLDIPRAQAGGLAAVVQVAWPASYPAPDPAAQIDRALTALTDGVADSPAAFIATSAAHIHDGHARGQVAVVLAVEAGDALGGQSERLHHYWERGVRVFQPVGNQMVSGDPTSIEALDGGLTPFGRRVLDEANRLGMLIDASHLTPRSLHDTLARSSRPVAFSHGACRALVDHPHNLDDATLRALASQGGVIGIAVVDAFLGGGSTVQTVADHIDHAVQCVGPEHVGLGTDFDGTDVLAAGLEDVAHLPALTATLLDRGYDEHALAAVLGGNCLRLLAAPSSQ